MKLRRIEVGGAEAGRAMRADRVTSGHRPWVLLLALLLCGLGAPGRADILSPIYKLTATLDGFQPNPGLIQAADGNLYGTTYGGGANGTGTIFRITTGGSFTVLYTFSAASDYYCINSDGANPGAGLIQAADGNLYGTTLCGGANGHGTIFEISTTGAFTSLYSFSAWDDESRNSDGAFPAAGLIQAADGNLYGTTSSAGANNLGTIFRITTRGSFTVLHTFGATPSSDTGIFPNTLIQARDGNLYGTTDGGGAYGWGSIFTMTTSGTFKTLHSFNGYACTGGLIQASDGNLYGTTDGTIFRITTSGTFKTLYRDIGGYPSELIQASDGNLYGTTELGGYCGLGTIFRITTGGAFSILYVQNNAQMDGSLVQASDGNFYGVGDVTFPDAVSAIFSFKIAPPTLSSLSPVFAQANTAFTLTLNGSAFVPGSVVEWNGKPLATTFVAPDQLTANVTTAVNKPLAAYPGAAKISVVNPDNSTSSTLSITVPTPVLTKLAPAALPHGSPSSTLTLTGTAFAPGAVVNWNSTTLTTTFVSPSKLTATIPASDLAVKGTAQVSVTNPNGGGTSQTLTFTIK